VVAETVVVWDDDAVVETVAEDEEKAREYATDELREPTPAELRRMSRQGSLSVWIGGYPCVHGMVPTQHKKRMCAADVVQSTRTW
jgi:hypothetical protein